MSIATPTAAKRYTPNTFFSIATPTAVMRHFHQQCSHQGSGPIVGTPKNTQGETTTPLLKSNRRRQSTAEKSAGKKRQPGGGGRQQLQQLFGGGELPVTVNAPSYVTPPRHFTYQQHHLIRREQSASAITIPKRNNNCFNGVPLSARRYTPPSAPVVQDHEVSPMFAGSKFIESPSAKSLPLPPSQWLEERKRTATVKEELEEGSEEEQRQKGATTISESGDCGGASSSSETNENFPGNWSPPTASVKNNHTSNGVRMHPLHLIAAAVMST